MAGTVHGRTHSPAGSGHRALSQSFPCCLATSDGDKRMMTTREANVRQEDKGKVGLEGRFLIPGQHSHRKSEKLNPSLVIRPSPHVSMGQNTTQWVPSRGLTLLHQLPALGANLSVPQFALTVESGKLQYLPWGLERAKWINACEQYLAYSQLSINVGCCNFT